MESRVVPAIKKNYGALFADEGIEQAGFAGIGSAYDGKAWQVVQRLIVGAFGEFAEYLVQEFACTKSVHGGQDEWFAQAQTEELGCSVLVGEGVHFVHRQHHGFSGLTKQMCHFGIKLRNALVDIYHEKDYVSLTNGQVDLAVDLALEDVV